MNPKLEVYAPKKELVDNFPLPSNQPPPPLTPPKKTSMMDGNNLVQDF